MKGSSALRLIGGELPDPPYPPDTRVKGWKYPLDYERMEASDTWALCPGELRGWLILVWLEGWKQTPAGSLPDDDAVISARIGMPLTMFQSHRPVLMRGWTKYSDGRLYHKVVVEKVSEMLAHREREKQRVSKYRDDKKAAELYGVRTSTYADVQLSTEPEPITGTEEQLLPSSANAEEGGAAASRRRPGAPPCPYERIVEVYHEHLPDLRRVAVLSERRKTALRARWVMLWRERGKRGRPNDAETLVERFAEIFKGVNDSDFLMGRCPPSPGRTKRFKANLSWLMNEDNFVKVIEGEYFRDGE